jgi:hypothetical protein
LNRRLSRADRWVALNVVELNSACASRRLTTNLGVGRSNRSGRASYLLHKSPILKNDPSGPRLKILFSLGFNKSCTSAFASAIPLTAARKQTSRDFRVGQKLTSEI